jgi:hypothetical protein
VIARRLVGLPALLALALGSGCRRAPPPPPVVAVPAPVIPEEPPWPGAFAAVRAAVDAGRFSTADSILIAFEQEHAGTPDASESAFWRAMLRADPKNPAFAFADARTALDAYLNSPGANRRIEAQILRRMLVLSDSLRTAQASQRTAAEARERAKGEELQKLRDELQRTQAELDRIKRRLGSPKP